MASQIAKSPGSKLSKDVAPNDSEPSRIAAAGRYMSAETRRRMLAEARHRMIAEAAYYIAAHRGFGTGRELDDWLLAENEIDMNLCEAAAQAPRWCDL